MELCQLEIGMLREASWIPAGVQEGYYWSVTTEQGSLHGPRREQRRSRPSLHAIYCLTGALFCGWIELYRKSETESDSGITADSRSAAVRRISYSALGCTACTCMWPLLDTSLAGCPCCCSLSTGEREFKVHDGTGERPWLPHQETCETLRPRGRNIRTMKAVVALWLQCAARRQSPK
jgi:hypothetical protein